MVKTILNIAFIILLLVSGRTGYGQVYLRSSGDGLLLTNVPQPDYRRLKKFKKTHKDEYKIMAQKAAIKYGLSYELIDAVIEAESGYNPQAISCKGAQGLMQLMPATADALKVSNVFNPEENIDAGARYLKAMMYRYGSVELALAAYNAGPKAVDKYKNIPPYKETQEYVDKIKKSIKKEPMDSHNNQPSNKNKSNNINKNINVKKGGTGNIILSN
jgi:soluble lytic murein transglycosylase-like protein